MSGNILVVWLKQHIFCINSANFTKVRRASFITCLKSDRKIEIFSLWLGILWVIFVIKNSSPESVTDDETYLTDEL